MERKIIIPSDFLSLIFITVVCVHVHSVPWHTNGGQKTTCWWYQFSPSTIWILGLELRSLASTFIQ